MEVKSHQSLRDLGVAAAEHQGFQEYPGEGEGEACLSFHLEVGEEAADRGCSCQHLAEAEGEGEGI